MVALQPDGHRRRISVRQVIRRLPIQIGQEDLSMSMNEYTLFTAPLRNSDHHRRYRRRTWLVLVAARVVDTGNP